MTMLSESTTAYLLCLECGHSHRCTCGGAYDPIVSAAICCQCDKEGRIAPMHKPEFCTINTPLAYGTSNS